MRSEYKEKILVMLLVFDNKASYDFFRMKLQHPIVIEKEGSCNTNIPYGERLVKGTTSVFKLCRDL